MVVAASLARDKFTMSIIEPPQRTRHIPGHLESGAIVATTRRPNLSVVRIVAFMLPRCTRLRCATPHKLGIQRCKGRAGSQIERLFERAASFARSLGKVAVVACIYQSVRYA
jgi:hypothetical protein